MSLPWFARSLCAWPFRLARAFGARLLGVRDRTGRCGWAFVGFRPSFDLPIFWASCQTLELARLAPLVPVLIHRVLHTAWAQLQLIRWVARSKRRSRGGCVRPGQEHTTPGRLAFQRVITRTPCPALRFRQRVLHRRLRWEEACLHEVLQG